MSAELEGVEWIVVGGCAQAYRAIVGCMNFLFLIVFVCVSEYVSAGAERGQERALDPIE